MKIPDWIDLDEEVFVREDLKENKIFIYIIK